MGSEMCIRDRHIAMKIIVLKFGGTSVGTLKKIAKVAKIITKKVKLLTISMGSGSGCDGQYLFSQDILGYNTGHVPRHSRIYRNFEKEFDKLHVERVNAYKEFIKDTEDKKFDDPKITVGIEDKEYESFLKLSDKYLSLIHI